MFYLKGKGRDSNHVPCQGTPGGQFFEVEPVQNCQFVFTVPLASLPKSHGVALSTAASILLDGGQVGLGK